MNFEKDLKYKNRKEKLEVFYNRYKDILVDSVLDVGADECLLLDYLPKEVKYKGIGLGSDNENLIKINLEKEKITLENNTYYTVICLDVLEHLDNIHEVFDELCRVSSKYVIISLPNPYNDFMNFIFKGTKYKKNLKFYGLEPEKESDRHKWFFSFTEACNFIMERGIKNNFEVVDFYSKVGKKWNSLIIKIFFRLFFRGVNIEDFQHGTMWWVLKKNKI